jgi:hypothetical protein
MLARHKGLGGGVGFVLPVTARTGRTTQALGHLLTLQKIVNRGEYE